MVSVTVRDYDGRVFLQQSGHDAKDKMAVGIGHFKTVFVHERDDVQIKIGKP